MDDQKPEQRTLDIFPMPEPQAGDRYTTPWSLVQALPEYPFDLDPCAEEHTAKANIWIPKEADGLAQKWYGKIFCNPPYSDVWPWIQKARMEVACGRAEVVVMLLKGDTSTAWFHEGVLPYAEIEFIRGRVRFNGKQPPWASLIARFHLENGSWPASAPSASGRNPGNVGAGNRRADPGDPRSLGVDMHAQD